MPDEPSEKAKALIAKVKNKLEEKNEDLSQKLTETVINELTAILGKLDDNYFDIDEDKIVIPILQKLDGFIQLDIFTGEFG